MKADIEQLMFIHKKLRDMALWLEEETGHEFTITSLYRIGDDGVHGSLPCRGMDLRCLDADIGAFTALMVNSDWSYDPNRPEMRCCIYHDVGQGAHLHLQVHPNTVRAE